MYTPHETVSWVIPCALGCWVAAVATSFLSKKGKAPKWLPVVFGLGFMLLILSTIGLKNYDASRLRAELRAVPAASVGKINLKRAERFLEITNAADMAFFMSQLQSVRSISAHHSHPTEEFELSFQHGGNDYRYKVGRDSDRSDEYWVFNIGNGRHAEIGRVQPAQFGPKVDALLGVKALPPVQAKGYEPIERRTLIVGGIFWGAIGTGLVLLLRSSKLKILKVLVAGMMIIFVGMYLVFALFVEYMNAARLRDELQAIRPAGVSNLMLAQGARQITITNAVQIGALLTQIQPVQEDAADQSRADTDLNLRFDYDSFKYHFRLARNPQRPDDYLIFNEGNGGGRELGSIHSSRLAALIDDLFNGKSGNQ